MSVISSKMFVQSKHGLNVKKTFVRFLAAIRIFKFQMNEWVEYLALPSYRVLKTQNTEKAKRWRQQLVQEIEVRRKQAYGEYLQRNQGMLVEFPPEDEKSKESRNREKNWWRVQIKGCKQFPKPISEAAKKFPGEIFF